MPKIIQMPGLSSMERVAQLIEEKKLPEALNEVERVLRTCPPTFLTPYSRKADILRWMGQYEQAIPIYSDIVSKNKADASHYRSLAYCHFQLRNHSESSRYFLEAEALEPRDPYTHYMLGVLTMKSVSRDAPPKICRIVGAEALAYFEAALSLDPDCHLRFFMGYVEMVSAFAWAGKMDLALDYAGQCEKAKPDKARPIKFRLINIANQQHAYNLAIRLCSELIEKNERSGTAYQYRAKALSYLGLYEEALLDFHTAVRKSPESAESYRGMGYAYLKLRDYPSSIDAYTQSLEYGQTWSAYFHRALAHAYAHEYDLARADARLAQPMSEPGRDVIAELEAVIRTCQQQSLALPAPLPSPMSAPPRWKEKLVKLIPPAFRKSPEVRAVRRVL